MSINRETDKEEVVLIYSGILLSHKKEQNNERNNKNKVMPSVASWMDSDTVILSEVREGQIYDNTHTWNKRYT